VRELGHPLAVVLTDPKNALFGLLTSEDIILAMTATP
jgi:hypothetical protein